MHGRNDEMPKLHNPNPKEQFNTRLPPNLVKKLNAAMLDPRTMKVKHGERSRISEIIWRDWRHNTRAHRAQRKRKNVVLKQNKESDFKTQISKGRSRDVSEGSTCENQADH